MTKRIRTYVLLLITLFTFCGCYDPTPYLGTWVTDIEEEDGYDGTLKLMLKEDDNMVIELEHNDGTRTVYAHLSFTNVKEGETVIAVPFFEANTGVFSGT